MNSEEQELLLDPQQLPWHPLTDGIDVKLLRCSAETGTWTVLLNCRAGSSFARHRHLGAGEYYVISGRMEYRKGIAVTGNYGYEPLGVIHDKTYFPEDTLLLFTNHGAVAFLDSEDGVDSILNHETLLAMGSTATA